MGLPRWMRITGCSAPTNAAGGRQFRSADVAAQPLSSATKLTPPRWNPVSAPRCDAQFGSRASRLPCHRRLRAGENHCERHSHQALVSPTQAFVPPSLQATAKPAAAKEISADKTFARRTPASQRQQPKARRSPTAKPNCRRSSAAPEVVAIALVGLLIICIIAGLYLAKAFFLPVTMAFIVGTMLSPAAGFLERYGIPRAVAAVLIVAAAGAGVAFMVGLIASPAVEWSNKLPELGALLKEKLHVFDRPLALWQQAAEHARRLRYARRRSICRRSTGCSRHWNSCRRPLPNSCCSSQR